MKCRNCGHEIAKVRALGGYHPDDTVIAHVDTQLTACGTVDDVMALFASGKWRGASRAEE